MRTSLRQYLWVLGLGICLAAAGCAKPTKPRPASDAHCFPGPARRWIAPADQSSVEAGARDTGGPVVAYIDHSGSMAGYLRAPDALGRSFQDLVAGLPDAAGVESGGVRRRLFGKTLRDVPSGGERALLEPETYACPSHARDCDNQESRLDLVLETIAAGDARALSLVVTDLWLDDKSILTSGSVALGGPLKRILLSGRSVAIYGVAAPYAGPIYDLPSGARLGIRSRRPLFLLAIGPIERLTALDGRLRRSSSKFIAAGVASGAIRHAVFTLTPETSGSVSPTPLGDLAPNPAIRPAIVMKPKQGLLIQQFAIDRGGLNTAAARGARPTASWSGPKDETALPGAVWTGPVAWRGRIWRLARDSAACEETDWEPRGEYGGGWAASPAGGGTFSLSPQEVLSNTGGSGVYLISGELVRTALTSPNPADAWMRAWSFAPEQEARAIAGARTMFPTLNLGETARLLENVLTEAAQEKPSVVGGFSVVVKVEN